jgi:hypothetical protein
MADTEDEDLKRLEARMKADFLPVQPRTGGSDASYRSTHALEYMAYHLGQLDRKVDRLIALLETLAAPRS